MTTGAHPEVAVAERLFRSGQTAGAEEILSRVTEAQDTPAKAFELLAYIRGNQGRLDECAELLRRATALPDGSGEAFFYLGRVQLKRGEFGAAVGSFGQSLRRAGASFEAFHEMGVAYTELHQHELALRSFQAAERLRPAVPSLQSNLGNAFASLRRYSEALTRYDRALSLDARSPGTWTDRGFTLAQLDRLPEALESYARALAIQPDFAPALLNQATTLWTLRRYADSIAAYEALLRVDPDSDYVPGYLLHLRMLACDWKDWDGQVQRIVERVRAGKRAATPFVLFPTSASAEVLLKAARTYALDHCPPREAAPFARPAGGRKIRVGYFSSGFRDHATAMLAARMFECQDRSRFEWFAYSLSPKRDAMTEHIASCFDQFADISGRTELAAARQVRADGIDIAVDLNGFTDGYRANIFAHRAAPIQVNFLGFPGSMGCDFMDYLIADPRLIQPDEYSHYAEKLVLLPDCYQPNDDGRAIGTEPSNREALGLPADAFVFASFNNNYKITPDVFDVWMRLLSAVPGSVLWLFKGNDFVRPALESEAHARGVDPARIVWAERFGHANHLERHRHADLFLDTFHYNAHTTCSDALWAGLPVLTLAGTTLASRVGASLLHAIGMPELITHTVEEYESAPRRLAASPAEVAQLRQRLQSNRGTAPLFDAPRFAKNIEAAYQAMWERLCDGLEPDHLQVGR